VAIDRILDMMRTLTYVTGQIVVPVLVARQQNILDMEIYNRAPTNLGMQEGEA
jgi:Na+/H+-dicarboxylate symporter